MLSVTLNEIFRDWFLKIIGSGSRPVPKMLCITFGY